MKRTAPAARRLTFADGQVQPEQGLKDTAAA